MANLISIIPDPTVLIELSTEELAETVLRIASERLQNEMVHFQSLAAEVEGIPGRTTGYPSARKNEVRVAIAEAWSWLVTQGLLIPEPNGNGQNGWMILSRRSRKLLAENSFKSYTQSLSFPKGLLHPEIADEVWLDIVRGDFQSAVFKAFRAVEIAVRTAGRYPETDVGVVLMRKAFDKNSGPLTDLRQPEPERDALAHLFAGAIGSYKNPHSHRTVTMGDPSEAQEMVLLASHLLRIVECRSSLHGN